MPVPDANTALHGPLRNRDTFIRGRDEITAFLTAKWNRELEYALRKNLWCFDENRIAVRFQYECHDRDGQWWRTYCNELWEFDEHGLMVRREASINDVAIDEQDRRILGPACGASYPCGRPPRGDGQALASSIARLPGGAPAPGPHRRCPA